ncbi:MAG: PTPA-CTERM sorting domain-containing protein [Cyanobacteria bacterium P01_D01_bin.105]
MFEGLSIKVSPFLVVNFFVLIMSPISLLKKVSSLAVFAALPFIFTEPASAFSLIPGAAPNSVVGVKDLAIDFGSGPQLFNVDFLSGSFNDVFGAGPNPLIDFPDRDDAETAHQAVAAALGTTFFHEGSTGDGVLVPYRVTPGLGISASDLPALANDQTRNAGFLRDTSVSAFGYAYADFSTAAEVPTPALLPGLIGMGVAAIRKRRLAQPEEA